MSIHFSIRMFCHFGNSMSDPSSWACIINVGYSTRRCVFRERWETPALSSQRDGSTACPGPLLSREKEARVLPESERESLRRNGILCRTLYTALFLAHSLSPITRLPLSSAQEAEPGWLSCLHAGPFRANLGRRVMTRHWLKGKKCQNHATYLYDYISPAQVIFPWGVRRTWEHKIKLVGLKSNGVKGIVHPKVKMCALFTHPGVRVWLSFFWGRLLVSPNWVTDLRVNKCWLNLKLSGMR